MALTFTPVIGLEMHVQLATKTKIFCNCSTDYIGAVPNTHICPLCTGQPGTLPLLNEKVVEYGVRGGLALHCKINKVTRFDRKNYFYPDLPKAYQITEMYIPLARDGFVEIIGDDGNSKKIRINRLHLEEDAGKLVHDAANGRIVGATHSFVDYNRSGVPLAEIVSEPDLASPAEAKAYVSKLRQLVRYLEISDGDMDKGSMRVDANISLKCSDGRWGNRAEVKNMNSLRAIEKALFYEIERQSKLLSEGKRIVQETRNWDDAAGVTVSSRSKEEANDYRYFPDPDLPPLVLPEGYVEQVEKGLPELPDERKKRFEKSYGLSNIDSLVLTEHRPLADFYEACVKAGATPSRVANWVRTEVLRVLNERKIDITEFPISAESLADLIKLIDSKKISNTAAKEVFDCMVEKERDLKTAMSECGVQVGCISGDKLEDIIKGIFEANADVVRIIRDGADKKNKKQKFLQGLVMRETRGQVNAREVAETLQRMLNVE